MVAVHVDLAVLADAAQPAGDGDVTGGVLKALVLDEQVEEFLRRRLGQGRIARSARLLLAGALKALGELLHPVAPGRVGGGLVQGQLLPILRGRAGHADREGSAAAGQRADDQEELVVGVLAGQDAFAAPALDGQGLQRSGASRGGHQRDGKQGAEVAGHEASSSTAQGRVLLSSTPVARLLRGTQRRWIVAIAGAPQIG